MVRGCYLSLSLACITVCSSTPILTSMPRISCLTLDRLFLMLTRGEPSVMELPRSSISDLRLSMLSVIWASTRDLSVTPPLTCLYCSLFWAKAWDRFLYSVSWDSSCEFKYFSRLDIFSSVLDISPYSLSRFVLVKVRLSSIPLLWGNSY